MKTVSKHWILMAAWALVMALVAATSNSVSAGDGHSHEHHEAAKHASGIVISAATSPAMAPGIKTSAVYLMLDNTGEDDIDLVGAESPAFAIGHLHKTSMVNGLMSMEPVAQLTIPAGGHVMFEPGGLHVMLMGAKKHLHPGDTFPLTLQFSNSEILEVPVKVVKPGEMSTHDHGSTKMN